MLSCCAVELLLCCLAVLVKNVPFPKGAFASIGPALLTGLRAIGPAIFHKSARRVPPLGGRGHQVHICRTAGKIFFGVRRGDTTISQMTLEYFSLAACWVLCCKPKSLAKMGLAILFQGRKNNVEKGLFATGPIFVCLASFQSFWHASHHPLQIGMLLSWAWEGVRSQELCHSLLEGCDGNQVSRFQIF